jgi:hemerythrin
MLLDERSRGSSFVWSKNFELGESTFDQEHRAFVGAIARLQSCPDDQLIDALNEFERHAIEHFGEEDRQINRGYPAGKCHLDDHRAVLASVAEVRGLVIAGNLTVGRRLAEELARWFPEHTDAMDRGLVVWIQRKRLGGIRIAMPTRRDAQGSG